MRASADWYDKYYALATDFAIIKTEYIKITPEYLILSFFRSASYHKLLRDTNVRFMWIKENMPVHVPSYIRYSYPYVPNIKEGRFMYSPKSRTK